MAITLPVSSGLSRPAASGLHLSAPLRRFCLLAVVAGAALAGFTATGAHEATQAAHAAGPELTHLLRAMAGLKMLFAGAAVGAIAWRLQAPAGWVRLAAYGLACSAMAAGPSLIWDMAHLRLGALLLHGGLLASVLLLWRDPATAVCLRQAIVARRAKF